MHSGPRGKHPKLCSHMTDTKLICFLISSMLTLRGVNEVKGIITVVYWRGCKNDQMRKELRKACKEKYRREILCYMGCLSLEHSLTTLLYIF